MTPTFFLVKLLYNFKQFKDSSVCGGTPVTKRQINHCKHI